MPGHEIIGRVVRAGDAVTKLAVGDLAAVGCMVGSCGQCSSCKAGVEQYCLSFPTFTYNSPDARSDGGRKGSFATPSKRCLYPVRAGPLNRHG